MKPIVRRQARIAAGYTFLAALLGALVISTSQAPPLGAWLVFAVAFVVLESNTAEVNDRMFQSSGVMVVLTAGTVFALESEASAVLAMVGMVTIGSVIPKDIRQRQWFQPLANLGQMVASATGAGAILDWLLTGISTNRPSTLARVALAGALASAVYTIVNVTMVRYAVRYVYGQRNLQPWSGLHVLLPSQIILGVVGGLLGAGLVIVAKPAVVVLILVVYLIAHLSFSSYSQLREAHQSALRGFVKALEARDLYTRGHTERVAYFAQLVGEELHFTGTQLERLRWASLIHDLGKLAIPGELIAKRGRLSPDEWITVREAARSVERILAEVDFLKPMVSISGVHYVETDIFEAEAWSLDASIVAVADAFDAMTSTRSYRMAMSQPEAFDELRADTSGRFYPDVTNALDNALFRTGEVYGGPTMAPMGPIAPAGGSHEKGSNHG